MLGELDRVLFLGEGFLGELKLVLVLGEAFQISHKLGLVLVELFGVLVQQLCPQAFTLIMYCISPKGVGSSTTLAWPGWKQPDIPVEVDTARLETSRTDMVKELPGYPVQNCPSGSFLF